MTVTPYYKHAREGTFNIRSASPLIYTFPLLITIRHPQQCRGAYNRTLRNEDFLRKPIVVSPFLIIFAP